MTGKELTLRGIALGVALTLVFTGGLGDSRGGGGWWALRADEAAAAGAGVPIVRTKLEAYATGAALGGISGAFLASYLTTVDPHQFTFSFSIFILAMVVLGGLGSIWGVVLGALVLVGLTIYVNFALRDSRVGRAWIAMRDDEVAAASAGVPIVRTKLMAYGVGAALGGVSGAFLASFLGTVDPHQFTFSFSIFILAMVVLGGLGSVWGVVLGAVLLSAFDTYLLPEVLYDVPGRLGLDFDLSQIASGIYGLLLVLVVLLRPQGLVPASRQSPEPLTSFIVNCEETRPIPGNSASSFM
jgi:ABC-type branched-subunit amino acid transport system permease subunit